MTDQAYNPTDYTGASDTPPVNPFLPSKLQMLGMMLGGLGSGISQAAQHNQPFWMGISPGVQNFNNSYYGMVGQGLNYDMALKNYGLQRDYKQMQERMLGLQARQLETNQRLQGVGIAALKKMGLLQDDGSGTPGFDKTAGPLLGPGSTPTPTDGAAPPLPTSIPPGVQMRMPMIAQAANQYGVSPSLLAANFSQESSGEPGATGPNTRFGQARGIAQLTDGTAKDLGVTNPYDPQQGINGGANYLGQMVRRYNGNETLGLIAYNWGPGNTDAWLKAGGDPSQLPAETRNHIQRVQAFRGMIDGNGGQPQAPTGGAPPGMPQPPQPPPNIPQLSAIGTIPGLQMFGGIAKGQQADFENKLKYYNALPQAAGAKAAAEQTAKAQARTDFLYPPGFDQAKTPEEKLKLLPPNIRGVVQDMGPDGDMALSDLPARLSSSGLDPNKIDINSITKAVYGDRYDMRQKELAKEFITNAYSGNKSEGATRLALITATQHLDTFASLIKAQANGDTPGMNAIVKMWNDQTGNPRFSSADALVHFLAPEAAKVVKGGGQLNEKEVEDNKDTLMTTKSWPQASAILQTWLGAMLARKNGLEETARSLGIPEAKISKLWGVGANGPDGKPQPSSMNKAISNFYSIMGASPDSHTAPPNGQLAPKSGTVLGKLKDGREVYVGSDGKRYVR